ncbi:short-chain dehydrogenase/reductase family 42E member 1-like isoform X1 [Montipora foliosa]|uniref:short-chain dehydrogenase/reductase family 42E member 1-like isoform X1 n=1 Tax=Montipora foliosa TaxID=591990 RepID=UPI0035F2074E
MSGGDRQILVGEVALITGGGGYLGRKLGNELLRQGGKVILFDISWPFDNDKSYSRMTCFKGDVTKQEDVEQVFEHCNVDLVFHCASYGMSGREQLNQRKIEKVNVHGTQNVLEACRKYNVVNLIYTSTYNVVFGGQIIRDGDESLPYLPLDQHQDHYSRTKSIAEQAVLNANGSSVQDGRTLRTCALRPPGIYGEGELRHLPRIVSYIKKGLFIFKYGQGDAVVDFVHVNNLVQAHILAGKALKSANSIAAGQAYFISDDSPVNNFEFFRPLVEGLGYSFPKIHLPITLIYMFALLTELVHSVVGKYIYNFQPLLTRTEVYTTAVTHYFSVKKARGHLGYNPQKYTLDAIIEQFKKTGHGRPKHPPTRIVYHIVNIFVGIMIACFILGCLPTVM